MDSSIYTHQSDFVTTDLALYHQQTSQHGASKKLQLAINDLLFQPLETLQLAAMSV